MEGGTCKCGHHKIEKLVMVLAWLAGIAFWLALWKGGLFWNVASDTWFQHVIVFSLLLFGMSWCGCCGRMASH